MKNLEEILKVDPNAIVRSFSKGQVLQQEGIKNTQTFFVKKGLLRSYVIDNKGKEHIFMFAPEGWIIADVESLEYGQATALTIDCIEDSEIIIFDKNGMFDPSISLEVVIDNFKLLYRRMAVLQRRILMQMSSPAYDRYHYFLKTYPTLVHRIPQHMIASYIGITPQALSALRAKVIQ